MIPENRHLDNLKIMKNKLTFFLVMAAIFVVPLSSLIKIPHTDIWYSQYIAFFCILCLGISLFVCSWNMPLASLMIISLVSTIYTAQQFPRAFFCLTMIYFVILGVYAISQMNEKQHVWIIRGLIGLIFLQGLWVVLQKLNIDPIFVYSKDPRLDDTVGFSASHNQIGLFFSVTSPIVFHYAPVLLPFSVLGILWSKTSTSWVAFFVGCLILGSFVNKKIVVGVFFLVLLFVIFFKQFDHFAPDERLMLYKETYKAVVQKELVIPVNNQIQILHCNPWFGYGLGNFTRFSPLSQKAYIRNFYAYEHAHNDYLEAFFEMGWLGLFAILAIIIDIIVKFIRTKRSKLLIVTFTALVIFGVNALGIYTVQTAVSGMILMILLGVFYGEVERQKISKV